MANQFQGILWAIESRTARSVWDFDRIYRSSDFNMPIACSRFFEQAGIGMRIARNWNLDTGSVLFFSSHTTALDGFGLPLACPASRDLKRVIFAATGLILGKPFVEKNILVYPKGSYRNMFFRSTGIWNRIIYLLTHRWGPFAPHHTATQAICRSLQNGLCVSILPSGIIGEPRWRSGIGAVVLETQSLNCHEAPIYAAPVYLQWNISAKSVSVYSPGLIRFDSILKQSGGLKTRDEVTEWMQKQYEAGNWQFDVGKH